MVVLPEVHLTDLQAALGYQQLPNILLKHPSLDSRTVVPGGVFVSLPGGQYDGRQYILQALEKGVSAVLFESDGFSLSELSSLQAAYPDVVLLPVSGLAKHLPYLAQVFYPLSSQKLKVVAITGTNGKTTTSCLVADAFGQLQQACGLVGTLGAGLLNELTSQESVGEVGNTTPDILTLYRHLFQFQSSQMKWAVIEASSHGLVQGRLESVPIHTAVWTNLSQDHLDYHGSIENYVSAKRRLIQWPNLTYAVLNLDDCYARQFFTEKKFTGQALTYSLNCDSADFFLKDIEYHMTGINGQVYTPDGAFDFCAHWWGSYNLQNFLAALAIFYGFDIDMQQSIEALSKSALPPGRLQRLPNCLRFEVIIDFAHTPDALKCVLKALRAHTQGRLYCLFGCGGDRDREKRSVMGAVAEQYADHVVITSDNPRCEHPLQIAEDILKGMTSDALYQVELDRAKAIEMTLTLAQPGDVVLIAGKGHETYQIVGNEKLAFNDRTVALRCLQAREVFV